MNYKTLVLLFLSGSVVFNCTKKTTTEDIVDSDVTTVVDNATIENVFNDVQNISDQAAKGNVLYFAPNTTVDSDKYNYSALKSSCATISHDSTSTPKTITIDFGSSNCLCNDGKNRRGQINVSYTGKYKDSLSVHSISFTDYYVNDNLVLGTKTVTNNGRNADGYLNYSIDVDGKLVKANTTDTIEWVSNRNRVWLEGESTLLNWLDDVYSIYGTASGVNSAGVSYTAVITTPLRRALSCYYFDSGVLEITPAGKVKRVIDFGDGTCDASATVSIAGYSFPVTMN